MSYNFLIASKSNLSLDSSKKKVDYKESFRNKLTMDPKSIFIANPPTKELGKNENPSNPQT